MPARRVYASRGVPSRGSALASRTRAGSASRLGLVASIALLGGAVAWLGAHALFAAGAPASQRADPAPTLGAVLELAPVSVGYQPAGAEPPAVASGALSTTRRWDASAPGIEVDPALVARLDQALVGVDGHLSVAVKDLGTGRGAVLDGNAEMPSASLYKLPVLYTVFDAGLSMAEELPITAEARSYDAGTMELGVGETLSVAEALERMVVLSDNTSAVMLGSRVGAARVNASIRSLGLETTHYSLERMTTSALDMLHFLDMLAHGQLVSSSASADMLHLLLRQRVNDRLPRLLPDDVQVAHKTGNLPGVVNEVGILYTPNSTVAVAALVSDTFDEATAATAIARLGLAAATYFQAEPAQTDRPGIPPAPARPVPPVWREPRPPATPTPAPAPIIALLQVQPTAAATVQPTLEATSVPTAAPTPAPTEAARPAAPAVVMATRTPTAAPTSPPTPAPRATPAPTAMPTAAPTVVATPVRTPTLRPSTSAPTSAPTAGRR